MKIVSDNSSSMVKAYQVSLPELKVIEDNKVQYGTGLTFKWWYNFTMLTDCCIGTIVPLCIL